MWYYLLAKRFSLDFFCSLINFSYFKFTIPLGIDFSLG
ncbi:hypothetical protein EC2865200_2080 [Escherichia coli 2865200]|nr:hypothetical protein EC2865200_2080 [Escherichia coli 2865200]